MERNQRLSATSRPDRRTFLRAIGVAGVAGLAGCTEGVTEDEGGGSGDELSGGAQNLIWATSAAAETYDALSREFESLIEEYSDNTVEVRTVDGETDEESSVEILRSLEEADIDFATLRNDVAHFGATGTGLEAFEGDPVKGIEGVATLYPEGVHVLTRTDAGIESLEDLEGATVDTGSLGSATRVNALRILESVGVSEGDFTEVNDGIGGTARLFEGASRGGAGRGIGFAQTDDGSTDAVDAAFLIGDWPVEAVEEAVETGEFDLLSLDGGTRSAIREENEWLTEDTVPAGTYDGVGEDVELVSVRAMIVTHQGVDDAVVGDVTTTIFENVDRIETKREFISSETAMDGMSIEMDPAAQRSLEEVDEGAEEDEPGEPDEENGEPDEDANGTEEGTEEPEDAEDDADPGTDDAEDAEDTEGGDEPGGADPEDDGAATDADGNDDADGSDDADAGDTEDTGTDGADDTGGSDDADTEATDEPSDGNGGSESTDNASEEA